MSIDPTQMTQEQRQPILRQQYAQCAGRVRFLVHEIEGRRENGDDPVLIRQLETQVWEQREKLDTLKDQYGANSHLMATNPTRHAELLGELEAAAATYWSEHEATPENAPGLSHNDTMAAAMAVLEAR